MALVNPNIAMSFRQPEITPRNALAEYAQLQQIQGGQQAQELARFQLGAAQRAESASNVQNELFAKHFDPTKGSVNVNAFVTEAAQRGQGGIIPGFLKTEADRQSAAATLKKTQGEIDKNALDLQEKKFKRAWQSAGAAATPQIAIDQLTQAVKSGEIDMATATREIQNLQNMSPDQYKGWRANAILKLLDAKDQLGFMLPKNVRQDAGGQILSIQDNPMLPGYGQPIAGAAIPKTATIGERTAQGQLNLAQQKFAFEKANPGFELKEDSEGNFFGVNKRTLQAIPVMVGGAAPAAAPAAPGAGMPGPRMPAPATQAIPGMTSVLDQPAPAAAAPVTGTPLRGKGTALTESQGNATAYGMRMREANAILEPLENAGKTNTGLIKGVVGGTVGLTPLIGEKLEDVSGSIFNALPRILGGLSPEQQQVTQARINFITAILRKESGAAIAANEFATAEKNYFPKPGDDAATIAQKQQARRTAIKAMEIQAGPGARQMGGAGGAGGVPGASANNPLGLPGL
jgi:hypothetical protein